MVVWAEMVQDWLLWVASSGGLTVLQVGYWQYVDVLICRIVMPSMVDAHLTRTKPREWNVSRQLSTLGYKSIQHPGQTAMYQVVAVHASCDDL